MRDDYDVVVVGARCAGAATALLLARGGLSVLVLDRARYGADTLSTHALTLPGVLQLHRWGVLDAVRAAGTPPVRRVVQHYGRDGHVAEIPISPRGGVDALYAPRRRLVDRLLVDAAAAAGAEIQHGVAARELLVEDGRVVGVRLGGRRGTVAVRAGTVVGADGAASGVARQAGAEVLRSGRHRMASIYTYVEGLPDDAFTNWFGPGLAGGLIPTDEGGACVWVGAPADRAQRTWGRDRARVLTDVLAELAPDVAAEVARRRPRGPYPAFAGRAGYTRRLHGPGWALVGDAAHYADPLGAHGMTDAYIGAELLARALLAVAGGADEDAELAGYARTHRTLTAPMAEAVEQAASFDEDVAGLQRAHLAMNEAMRAEWAHLAGLEAGPVRRSVAVLSAS